MRKVNNCFKCKKQVIALYSNYNKKEDKVEWLCNECYQKIKRRQEK